ncbi:MAG: recombinase family protein, partial [Bryobacteraceae bacterium]
MTEPIDTSNPMGEMIFTLLAGFAAEERRMIIRRTLAGKREKASRVFLAFDDAGVRDKAADG